MLFSTRLLAPGVLILLAILGAHAQDSSRVQQIGIGTGYVYAALKAEYYSPLTQTGASLPIQAYYRIETPRYRAHLQLYRSSITLTSKYGELITTLSNFYSQGAFHSRFGSTTRRITIWGGFVLSTQIIGRRYSTASGNLTAGNNNVNEGYLSLSPSVLFERKFGNDKLSLQVWTSVFELASFPNYGGLQKRGFVSLGTFTNVESRISYSRYLDKRWEARLDGQFQLYRLTDEQTITQLNIQCVASIVYKFK